MLGKKLEKNGREKVFWWKMAGLIVYTVKFTVWSFLSINKMTWKVRVPPILGDSDVSDLVMSVILWWWVTIGDWF